MLCFYSKTGFWPSYCQIWTDLDKIVVRNTLAGQLRPRSAHGRLQAKPEWLFCFVILVTHPKSYIETAVHHLYIGKLSEWRWGRVLLWKVRIFFASQINSEGLPFASLESVTRHLADIGPWVPKSGHVTITKIDNLHIDTRRKIHWFHKCYSFRSTTKNNEVIAEKPFQKRGVTRRLAVWNWRSSSVHASSQCCYC